MTISEKTVRQAAFWEETICPNCGETGGEVGYACFACDRCVVMPAKQVAFILDNVEREDNSDGPSN